MVITFKLILPIITLAFFMGESHTWQCSGTNLAVCSEVTLYGIWGMNVLPGIEPAPEIRDSGRQGKCLTLCTISMVPIPVFIFHILFCFDFEPYPEVFRAYFWLCTHESFLAEIGRIYEVLGHMYYI